MPSKKKFILLMVVSILILIASYSFGFSKTLQARRNYQEIKKQEELYKDVPKQIQLLSKKKVYYDSILTQMNLSNTSLENSLLKIINNNTKTANLKLQNFNTPHLYLDDNAKLLTYNFKLEGNYNSLLKLIYTIERNGSFGEVIHLDFLKEQDFKTKRKYLTAKVLIQNMQ